MVKFIEHPDGSHEYIQKTHARSTLKAVRYYNGHEVPTCGATNSMGGACGNGRGAGTDHKGVGRCYRHGGVLQEEGKGKLMYNRLTYMAEYPGIKEKAEMLAKERDVFDLRDHIFLMEAIIMTVLEKAKTMEDLGAVVKYADQATKVIQRLDEIEHGRRMVIDVQGVNIILAKVQEAITRYVGDSYTRDLIARDIASISVGGASSENIPNSKQPALIEGVAMEDRPREGS